MRILVIVPWYEPAWGAGGTATAVSSLNRELVKNSDIDITVLTTNDAGGGKYLDLEMDREYDFGGVKVYYYPCDFMVKSKEAFYSSELVVKIKKEIPKYDLIHVHGTRHAYGFVVAYNAKKHDKKYIITPHASLMQWWMDEIGRAKIKKLYMKYVESFVIRNSHALHFLTEEEKFQSRNYIYNTDSFIVSNGIEIQKFKRDSSIRAKWRKQYNVEDKNVLLFLGRIHPQKNIHLILESLKSLENTIFFIVGPVGDQEYYSKIIKIINNNNLKNKVVFIPPVDKDEVKYWYWFADYFVSASVVEGVSMSIIEALASSLPVIVSKNVANYREVKEDNCGLIVETNVSAIRNMLSEIENGSINSHLLSANSELSAIKRYDIKVVAKYMLENYNRILSE